MTKVTRSVSDGRRAPEGSAGPSTLAGAAAFSAAAVRVAGALASWPYALALTALVLNDTWLKTAYPGFVTGKLSDFAGMLVVGIPLMALFRRRHVAVSAMLCIAFLWWKSPASAPFIVWVRDLGYDDFGRVVDYGDLAALCVLPLGSAIARRPVDFALSSRTLRRALVAPILAVSALSILGTSFIMTRQEYSFRNTSSASPPARETVAAAIRDVAERHGLTCVDCSRATEAATFGGAHVTATYSFVDARTVSFKIFASPSGLFFGPSGRENAERIRRALKSEFGSRFREVEYVESLDPGQR